MATKTSTFSNNLGIKTALVRKLTAKRPSSNKIGFRDVLVRIRTLINKTSLSDKTGIRDRLLLRTTTFRKLSDKAGIKLTFPSAGGGGYARVGNQGMMRFTRWSLQKVSHPYYPAWPEYDPIELID